MFPQKSREFQVTGFKFQVWLVQKLGTWNLELETVYRIAFQEMRLLRAG